MMSAQPVCETRSTGHTTSGVLVIGADPGGRGFGARAHVPAVHALDEVELVGVCTSHEDTAHASAARFGAGRAFWDVEEAVGDPSVGLVTVAVRVGLHAGIVETAIRARKPVYCEWPLALDSVQATSLVRLAEAHGVPTAIGTQGRFSPEALAAQEAIAAGRIGRPLSFQAAHLLPRFPVASDRQWLARQDQGSGALFVANAHATDILQFLLGPIAAIAGAQATRFPDDIHPDTGERFRWTAADTVSWVARLGDGTIGSGHVSNTTSPGVGFSLRIVGEEGQLVLTTDAYASFGAPHLGIGRAGNDLLQPVAVAEPKGLQLGRSHPGRNVALALRAFVRDGDRFRPSFADGAALHRVLEAIERSDAQGTWVEL